MRFAAFYAQLNWLQNVWRQFLNFCPNFFEPPKVKKIEIFLTLEGSLNFWGENLKFRLQRFATNLSVCIMLQSPFRYFEDCCRRIYISVNLYFFNKNWQQCKLATANFQNILNRLSNWCL